jgi:flagellar motor switch/type III secretory pathway protein FliN
MSVESPTNLGDYLTSIPAYNAGAARLLFDTRFHQLLSSYCPDLKIEHSNTLRCESFVRFSFDTHHGSFELFVPDKFFTSLTSIIEGDGWSQSLKLQCLWAVINADWEGINSLLDLLGWTLSSVERCSENPPEGGIHFLVTRGTLRANCLLWNFDCRLLKEVDDSGLLGFHLQPSIADRICPTASLIFKARRFAWGALLCLHVGDAIILQKYETQPNNSYAIQLAIGCRGGPRVFRNALWDGNSVAIQGDKWMNIDVAESVLARQDGSEPQTNLADIEVEVQLELQLVAMPIKVLSAMQPGYVLELPVSVEDVEVCLVVGGQVIGYAQLVRVADRLAARITRIKNDPGRAIAG